MNLKFEDRRILPVLILICCSVLLTFCKHEEVDEYRMGNQEFVTKASSNNNFKIAVGELAKAKGVMESVRHYGADMVTDHKTADLEMQNLASQKKWTVSEQLMAKEQTNLALLTPLSGAAFDKEFARIMIVSHGDAIALFELASANKGIQDKDLRDFAATKLPSLKTHLEEAIALQVAVNQ